MIEQRTKNRLTLLLVIAAFVGPILVAWAYVNGIFDWHARGLVNRGDLVAPPLDLSAYASRPALTKLFALQPSEWAMVYLEPATCGVDCAKHLDNLLTIREVLGQSATRTSVHALSAVEAPQTTHAARVHVDAEVIADLRAGLSSRRPAFTLPAIVFVDWRHQLMMYYPTDAPLASIKKDLQRLLRASAIR